MFPESKASLSSLIIGSAVIPELERRKAIILDENPKSRIRNNGRAGKSSIIMVNADRIGGHST